MYCRNCSNEISAEAIACPKCGVPPFKGKHFCHNCGASTHEDAILCVSCGCGLTSAIVLPPPLINPENKESQLYQSLVGNQSSFSVPPPIPNNLKGGVPPPIPPT